MNSYQASLSNLFKAEEQANNIIRQAEEDRERLLEQAIQDANAEVEKLRREEENKFKQSTETNQNNFAALEEETRNTKRTSTNEYEKNKSKVVEFLIERITTVDHALQRNVKGDFHLNYKNER